MRSSFSKLTIERLRYPIGTDQGAPATDFTAEPATTPIPGCWYEPTTSMIDRDGRTAVRTGYTVDAPADTDLEAVRDHVRIAGKEYELDGDPLDVPSPTGTLRSTRFTCYRWEG